MQILNFVSGVLKMYVASKGNMIPVGETVDVYRVKDGNSEYFKICNPDYEPVFSFGVTKEYELLK